MKCCLSPTATLTCTITGIHPLPTQDSLSGITRVFAPTASVLFNVSTVAHYLTVGLIHHGYRGHRSGGSTGAF